MSNAASRQLAHDVKLSDPAILGVFLPRSVIFAVLSLAFPPMFLSPSGTNSEIPII